MTVDWTDQLLGQFDLRWNLAHGPSLETLTDEEYLWEPVSGCWSIRPAGPGGRGEIEQTWPDPEPAPVTTIAWRLSHLAVGVSVGQGAGPGDDGGRVRAVAQGGAEDTGDRPAHGITPMRPAYRGPAWLS